MDKLTDLLAQDYSKEFDIRIAIRRYNNEIDLIFTAYGVSEFFVVKVLEHYSGLSMRYQ